MAVFLLAVTAEVILFGRALGKRPVVCKEKNVICLAILRAPAPQVCIWLTVMMVCVGLNLMVARPLLPRP